MIQHHPCKEKVLLLIHKILWYLKFQCHFQCNCDCDCPKKIKDSSKDNKAIDTPHWNKSAAWKHFGQSQDRLTDKAHAIRKKYSRGIKKKPGISLSSPLTCCSCIGNIRFSVLKAKHTSNNSEWQRIIIICGSGVCHCFIKVKETKKE